MFQNMIDIKKQNVYLVFARGETPRAWTSPAGRAMDGKGAWESRIAQASRRDGGDEPKP